MKILLISHEMTYTGAPYSLLNAARVLKKAGHKVKVVSLIDGDFSKEFKKYGFRVGTVNFFDKHIVDTISREYDIAIANTIFCSGAAIALQDRMTSILYIREAENLPEIMKNCGISDLCISNARNIICVSEYAAKFIRQKYSPERMWVLHNFLIPPPFFKTAVNKVHGDKVCFLIAGTIEKRKGIDIAIKAFNMLPENIRKKAVLRIAGRVTPWAAEYSGKVFADAADNPNIKYLGEFKGQSRKKRIISKANVIIVPSFDESCSLSALEGAMYGKALIVTENVGAKYIVKNCGFVVKTGSAEELSEAMKFMICENELEEMGRNAFENFRKFSSPKNYLDDITEIFNEIGGE